MALNIINNKVPSVSVTSTIGYSPIVGNTNSNVKIAIIGQSQGYTSTTEQKVFKKGQTSVTLDGIIEGGNVSVSGRYGAYLKDVDYTATGSEVSKKITRVGTITSGELAKEELNLVVELSGTYKHIDDIPLGKYILSASGTVEGEDRVIEVNSPAGDVRLADGGETATVALKLVLVDAQSISLNDTPVPLYVVKDGRQLLAKQIEPELVGDTFTSGVTVYNADGKTKYTEGVDYVVHGTRSSWTIARVATSTALEANETVFVSFGETAIGPDETVSITYDYVPEDYYTPKSFFGVNELINTYGQATDEIEVLSPLSLAGQIAFAHGAGEVVGVPIKGNSTQDFANAIRLLESIYDVSIIIPLTGNTAVHDLLFDHCVRMSAQGEERRTFIGADGVASPISSSSMQSMVKYWSEMSDTENQRVLFVSPSSFAITGTYGNTTITVAGYYLACAIAGVVARNGVSVPVTHKRLSNAIILTEPKTKLEREAESVAGLCVVENRNGAVVVHGRTTSNMSVEEQELNVVMSHDVIVRSLRTALSNGIVGQPLTDMLIVNTTALAKTTMDELLAGGYCRSFVINPVTQTENPTTILVDITYRPVYGVNYIKATISIDPTIG